MNVDLVEVPFNSAGLSSGVARMPDALREAGLHQALRADADLAVRRVDVGEPVPERGPCGLLAESALATAILGTRDAVAEALRRGRFPLVVAGDCPALIGAVSAMQSAGQSDDQAGLVFLDGHEDAWPPSSSPSGEAADSEIALALGLADPPAALRPLLPCLRTDQLLMLGPRDAQELAAAGVTSLAAQVPIVDGDALAAACAGPAAELSAVVGGPVRDLLRRTPRWWLHIDLDVLSTRALPAVDYPQPGGLSWPQLLAVCRLVVAEGGCRGASVVIYNPDLDAGAAAGTIVGFIRDLTALIRSAG